MDRLRSGMGLKPTDGSHMVPESLKASRRVASLNPPAMIDHHNGFYS